MRGAIGRFTLSFMAEGTAAGPGDASEPWRPRAKTVEVLALVVSLAAAAVATWQAVSATQSAERQEQALKRATADQVLILGEPADVPISGGAGGSWSVFADTPTRVQNYGRLPVTDVTVEVQLVRDQNKTSEVVLVEVGPLPPCHEVSIVDEDALYDSGDLAGVTEVRLRLHYTDPQGNRWWRGTSGPPQAGESAPQPTDAASLTRPELHRSEITPLTYCAPTNYVDG